jgi:hypothetical protein
VQCLAKPAQEDSTPLLPLFLAPLVLPDHTQLRGLQRALLAQQAKDLSMGLRHVLIVQQENILWQAYARHAFQENFLQLLLPLHALFVQMEKVHCKGRRRVQAALQASHL